MATLPALFYAASRCDRRAIMVGDPRQLPPIVQSDDELRAPRDRSQRLRGRGPRSGALRAGRDARRPVPHASGRSARSSAGCSTAAASRTAPPAPRRSPRARRSRAGPSSSSTRQSTCERSAKGSSRINAGVGRDHGRPRARGGARRLDVDRGDHAVRGAGRRDPPAARRSATSRMPSSAARSIASRAASAMSCSSISSTRAPMRPSALARRRAELAERQHLARARQARDRRRRRRTSSRPLPTASSPRCCGRAQAISVNSS